MTYLKRFRSTYSFISTMFSVFEFSVQFKIVHFLHSCISAHFSSVIAAYSVNKNFLTLPLVRCSFARGRHWDFGYLVQLKSEFSS